MVCENGEYSNLNCIEEVMKTVFSLQENLSGLILKKKLGWSVFKFAGVLHSKVILSNSGWVNLHSPNVCTKSPVDSFDTAP